MPFILKKHKATIGKKIHVSLMQDAGLSLSFSQRMVSKARVFDEQKKPYKIYEEVREASVYIAVFEGHTRGLKPLISFKNFALFDKPSHLMIHPNSKKTAYSLLDEIRFHFGEDANQVHRIDAETSGLVLVGLNEKSINELGDMFEQKKYKKSYFAIVRNELKEEITINKALNKEGKKIGVRMKTCEEKDGKSSVTHIKPLIYNKKTNCTLVQAIPITGRQHQIRVHLHSIDHTILGDPIYGVSDDDAEDYLNKTLSHENRVKASGGTRLWLQADYLEFSYKDVVYKIHSKNKDIYKEFEKNL